MYQYNSPKKALGYYSKAHFVPFNNSMNGDNISSSNANNLSSTSGKELLLVKIGLCHEVLEDNESALRYYKLAQKKNEDFVNPIFHIGCIYDKMNKTEEALEMLEIAYEKEKENVDYLQKYGDCLVKSDDEKKISKGILILEKGIEFFTGNIEIISSLAKGYEKQGRLKEAISILEKAQNNEEFFNNKSKIFQLAFYYEKNKEYNDELDIDLNEEMYINKKYSKKNFKKFNRIKKKNTISEVGSGEILASSNEYHKKLSKKNKLNKSFDNKINTKEIDKKELEYPLILISANNKKGDDALKSNYIINNYDFDEAVYYEKRSFCRIFYIFLISKENNLNIILVNLPLELKPIRICVFIFSYACDFALNALFYLSDNISDKYHYSGAYRELFSLVNNIIISIVSAVVSFLLLTFFQTLTQSTSKIEAIFRKQELLLKTDKNYKVTEHTKMEIQKKIDSIMKCLKIKIICFIIMELLFMLFFFYYVTAFCQVYHSTQVSWLLDFLSSFVFSLLVTIVICFICALCYRVSIKYKLKILYKITTFICSS